MPKGRTFQTRVRKCLKLQAEMFIEHMHPENPDDEAEIELLCEVIKLIGEASFEKLQKVYGVLIS